jgi:hypothetical protein
MSVNEMAMQTVWQHHFPEPCGGGGALWDKLAHRGRTSLHILHILCDFLYTFYHKMDTKDGFEEKCLK